MSGGEHHRRNDGGNASEGHSVNGVQPGGSFRNGRAPYNSSPSFKSGRLFLGRLRQDVDDETLKRALTPFGKVVSLRIVVSSREGRHKRFAFCDLDSPLAADAAISSLHGSVALGDPSLFVAHSTDPGPPWARQKPHSFYIKEHRIQSATPSAPVPRDNTPTEERANPSHRHEAHQDHYPTAFETEQPTAPGAYQNWTPSAAMTPLPMQSMQPPSNSHGPITTLYVRGLLMDTDEVGLWHLFAPFGCVVASKILRNVEDGSSRGEGFVEFAERHEAEAAMAGLNGIMGPTGRPFRVHWAHRQLHMSHVSCGAVWTMQQMAYTAMQSGYPSQAVSHPAGMIPIHPPPESLGVGPVVGWPYGVAAYGHPPGATFTGVPMPAGYHHPTAPVSMGMPLGGLPRGHHPGQPVTVWASLSPATTYSPDASKSTHENTTTSSVGIAQEGSSGGATGDNDNSSVKGVEVSAPPGSHPNTPSSAPVVVQVQRMPQWTRRYGGSLPTSPGQNDASDMAPLARAGLDLENRTQSLPGELIRRNEAHGALKSPKSVASKPKDMMHLKNNAGKPQVLSGNQRDVGRHLDDSAGPSPLGTEFSSSSSVDSVNSCDSTTAVCEELHRLAVTE